jgi:hypothetical protein
MQNGGNLLPKTKGGLLVGGRAVNQVYRDRGHALKIEVFAGKTCDLKRLVPWASRKLITLAQQLAR